MPGHRIAAATLTLAAHCAGATEIMANLRLADLSLEQLSNIEVTSVAGRRQNLQDAAASIYVITGKDIRRSAAMSLPEALRLAPNLQVAQSSAGSWAISARGFNNEISNKLLVLIDGRTVYSALFSGVLWDAHSVLLEDVDRIEVISGPGGTLWGANAVNGIINVITRSAADTQGVIATAARSHRGGREAVRWGGRLGEAGHIRLYGLAVDRDNTRTLAGADRNDGASRNQLGFRSDWEWGQAAMTVQGDVYRGVSEPYTNLSPKLRRGNLLARWSSVAADGGPYQLQAYYDHAERDEVTVFRNTARNLDLKFTHEPVLPAGHQLLWGAGYRRGEDINRPNALVLFRPAERTLSWAHVFAQHEMSLGTHWRLTLGAKAERNSYTSAEFLPSARLAYQHSAQQTTWAATSRVVRAPSRIDREFFFPAREPFFIAGGADFQSETAKVLEIGHRGQVGAHLNYLAAVFQQYYEGLRAGVPGQMPAVPSNQIEGPSCGIEASAVWQATTDWRLSAGAMALRKSLYFSSGATDATSIPNLGNDPRFQWHLRSSLNLGPRSEFDLIVRRVGALPTPAVPAYTAVDARIALRVTPTLELALLGQNLFDRRHVEFNSAGNASQIERRLYLKATWQL